MTDYKKRWKDIQKEIARQEADGFLVSNYANIRYLSCSHVAEAFPSSSVLMYIFVPPKGQPIGVASALEENRAKYDNAVKDVRTFAAYDGIPADGKTMGDVIKGILKKNNVKTLLTDSPAKFYGIKTPRSGHILNMRAVKDSEEISRLRKANRIALKAAEALPDIVVPGKTELDVVKELDFKLRDLGAEAIAFSTIVASGPHSWFPHHDVGKRKIGKRDAVVVDYGAYYQGYCSDITRTLLMPSVSKKVQEIYDVVEESQKTAIRKAKAGVPLRDLEAGIRELFKEYGYNRYFCHSTGHGIGLEVHEAPWVRITSPKKDVLVDGNVFTIEPGIYVPEVGGIRIEDDIFIGSGQKVQRV